MCFDCIGGLKKNNRKFYRKSVRRQTSLCVCVCVYVYVCARACPAQVSDMLHAAAISVKVFGRSAADAAACLARRGARTASRRQWLE